MNDNSISSMDSYKIALDTRNLEISLFWKRSNYFLVLNTALAIGFFHVGDKWYSILLAILGAVVSILWFLVNLGSKCWQSRWEHRLQVVEEQIEPRLDLFAANAETIQEDVRKSLENGSHKGLQKLLDRLVLRKPSVSYQMIRLSLIFVAAWVLLLAMKAIW